MTIGRGLLYYVGVRSRFVSYPTNRDLSCDVQPL